MHGVCHVREFSFYFISVGQLIKTTEWVGASWFARNITLVCLEWVSKEIGWSGERRGRGRKGGETGCLMLGYDSGDENEGLDLWDMLGVEWQDLKTSYVRGRLWCLPGAYVDGALIHWKGEGQGCGWGSSEFSFESVMNWDIWEYVISLDGGRYMDLELGKEPPLERKMRNYAVGICSHWCGCNCPDRTCRRLREKSKTELRNN